MANDLCSPCHATTKVQKGVIICILHAHWKRESRGARRNLIGAYNKDVISNRRDDTRGGFSRESLTFHVVMMDHCSAGKK
jgi:hypothetical protein